MKTSQPCRIKTISEYHQIMGLPKPEHPLVSVINMEEIKYPPGERPTSVVFDFYLIALKRHLNTKFKYGQQAYDFDEGIMFFISPGQVFGVDGNADEGLQMSGWMLFIHPDFLWNTSLNRTIKQYEYFEYSVNEALHLSEKEESMIIGILKYIEQEYHTNIDKFSQNVIINQIELLLNYSDRFYHRQFLTRQKAHHQILHRLEAMLTDFFKDDGLLRNRIPTVKYIAASLNLSPNYLSGMLKVLTGKSTQQHIQDKVIDKAKEKLSITNLSVSEIAYELGFEYPQTFSNLFKKKTNLSPLEFRKSFN